MSGIAAILVDVMQSTARVLTLLEVLQSGGTRTVAELAERLAVDQRTVRRYVEHLRDLDIPVDSVRGRYGGYRLGRHYRMPPLMLTDEEALAVVWALLLTGWSGRGPASAAAVENATAKVRRVLPAALGRRIDAVFQTVDFAGDRSQLQEANGLGNDTGARVLLELAEAARDRRPVGFDYTSRHGRASRREVRPHGVVAHHGLLYLTGFDVTRDAVRTFRLDRILHVRQMEGSFTVPDDANSVQQVLGPLPPGPGRHDVSVRVHADADHVRTYIPEILASVTPLPAAEDGEEWVRVFLRAERLEWVAGRLAILDRPFVVEAPLALNDVVKALARRLLAASRSTS
jgi:predicted DNA-binding transcriptional regulator YafY